VTPIAVKMARQSKARANVDLTIIFFLFSQVLRCFKVWPAPSVSWVSYSGEAIEGQSGVYPNSYGSTIYGWLAERKGILRDQTCYYIYMRIY
jgi:hypothetical protein